MSPNTAMDSPVLELKIVSANDLKKPGPFSSALQTYVVVSISGTGAAAPSLKTPLDTSGGRNPTWNHHLTVSVPETLTGSLFLRLQILSRRSIAADKFIGEVCVPLRELLQSPAADPKFVSYQVKKPSGRSKGVLTFSYRLPGVSEPVMAYPAMPMPSAPPVSVDGYKHHVYPPVAAPTQGGYGYGYGYPSQTGYGYGPYGYSGQVIHPNCRKKSSGLGLGAGLLGGALAGFLVGDLVSDAAFDFGGGDGFF